MLKSKELLAGQGEKGKKLPSLKEGKGNIEREKKVGRSNGSCITL